MPEDSTESAPAIGSNLPQARSAPAPQDATLGQLSPEIIKAAADLSSETWSGWAIRFLPRLIKWTVTGYRIQRRLQKFLAELEPMAVASIQDQHDRRESDLNAVSIGREYGDVVSELIDRVSSAHFARPVVDRDWDAYYAELNRIGAAVTRTKGYLPDLERTPSSRPLRVKLHQLELGVIPREQIRINRGPMPDA